MKEILNFWILRDDFLPQRSDNLLSIRSTIGWQDAERERKIDVGPLLAWLSLAELRGGGEIWSDLSCNVRVKTFFRSSLAWEVRNWSEERSRSLLLQRPGDLLGGTLLEGECPMREGYLYSFLPEPQLDRFQKVRADDVTLAGVRDPGPELEVDG